MAAFRRFDPVQMQLPWREPGGLQPGMGAGCERGRCGFLLPASRISTKDTKGHEEKRRRRSQGDDRKSGPRSAAGAGCEGGDAASFCQLRGYPRRTQRGTKESGDGDPREMTANLDRAPPPARGVKGGDAASFCQLQGYPRRTQRGTKKSGDGDPREMTANLDRAPPPAQTVNRADRVFSPFAARHHSFNLQCLNPIWKGAWQHFGALTQFRCNCPGGGGVQPGMGAGCEGGAIGR